MTVAKRGGARLGAGRPATGRAGAGKTVSVWIDAADIAYLDSFCAANRSLAVRELIDRARKMWPIREEKNETETRRVPVSPSECAIFGTNDEEGAL